MHLGTTSLCRLTVLNRRILNFLFALLLGCAALSLPSGGGRVLADEMGPTPVITDFECRLEGGWIIMTGTVNTAGTVEITGLTVFSFTVTSGEQFSEQVAYTGEMHGFIFAQLGTALGLISDLVWDFI